MSTEAKTDSELYVVDVNGERLDFKRVAAILDYGGMTPEAIADLTLLELGVVIDAVNSKFNGAVSNLFGAARMHALYTQLLMLREAFNDRLSAQMQRMYVGPQSGSIVERP